MTRKAKRIPAQEVLDTLASQYTYNSDTGEIKRHGNTVGTKNIGKTNNYIQLVIRLETTLDGIQRSYPTRAHQVAWYLTHGEWTIKDIDHIDGDGTNNKLSNLRLATRQQNLSNKRKCKKETTSKHKGVHKTKHLIAKPWRATITDPATSKYLHIGYYATEDEAAKAYDAKATELNGQFVYRNFPLA